MTGFKNLLLAFTVLSASTAAFASDDSLANQVLRKSTEKDKKSLSLNKLQRHRRGQSGQCLGGASGPTEQPGRLLRHLRQRVGVAQWH